MITLKEYEIYFKVKINRVGIIPAYVPLIIHSHDMEPTKYYSLSAAARGCGVSKQTISYVCKNRCTRTARKKGRSKVFRTEWLALPRWSLDPARQSAVDYIHPR